jgi:uncharacterized protein (DUF433 family)
VDYRKRIKVIAGKRGGHPMIRGLRITVADVLSYLAAGMTEDPILAAFPDRSTACRTSTPGLSTFANSG